MSFLYDNRVSVIEPTNAFSEVQVIQRTPIIEIIPLKGTSQLRDITEVTGTGSISNDNLSELNLQTGTTISSNSTLYSAERGRYMSGFAGECGIGVRFNNTTFLGTAYSEWGYGNDLNGFFFGIDSTGVYVKVLRNSTVIHKVYQSSWNLDKLDGTGISGTTFDVNNGNIYQIEFTWYGYGDIVFQIIDTDERTNKQIKHRVHVFRPEDQTSVRTPNLPIRAFITNGGEATNYEMFIGGRQFSVIGPFLPNNRLTHETVLNVSTSTTRKPLVSFKSKNTESDLSIAKKVEGLELVPVTEPIIIEVVVNGAISNTASFRVPTNVANTETSLQVDTTATTCTGGIVIWEGIVPVGGSGGANRSGNEDKDGLFVTIPENQTVSLCVKTFSGTGTASATFKIREEW